MNGTDEEIIALTRKRNLQRKLGVIAFSILAGTASASVGITLARLHRAHEPIPPWLWSAVVGIVLLAALVISLMLHFTRPPAGAYSKRLVQKRADELQGQMRRFFLIVVPISMPCFAAVAEMDTASILRKGFAVSDLFGIAVFLFFGFAVLWTLSPRGWRRSVRTVLDDELTRSIRQRALALGFWVLTPCLAALYSLALYDRKLALEAMVPALYLTVAVPTLRFAYLDWRVSRGKQ